MEEKFYLPSIKDYITIKYNYNKKTQIGNYIIKKGKTIVEESIPEKYNQEYYLDYSALKRLIEIFNKNDDDIYAIQESSDSLFSIILEGKYELLDKTVSIDQIDCENGSIKRIIFYDNKIIKISTYITNIYLNGIDYAIEYNPTIEILKNI